MAKAAELVPNASYVCVYIYIYIIIYDHTYIMLQNKYIYIKLKYIDGMDVFVVVFALPCSPMFVLSRSPTRGESGVIL